jgi:hypothetical protein
MTTKEEIYSRTSSVWLATLFISLLLVLQNSFAIGGEGAQQPVQGKSLQLETTSAITLNGSMGQSRRPPKGNPKLGSSLNKLLEKQGLEGLSGARTLAKSLNMVLQDDRIQVTIVTGEKATGDVRKAVEAIGGEYQLHYRNLVQVLVPISALRVLAKRTDVQIIREPRRAILAKQTISFLPAAGNQTTEGEAESNASVFHAARYDGTGVRVAVIDGEFGGYTGLQGTDLPATVNTYDWTGTGMGGGPHGTACAEVVFDVAPGISMDLHKINTPVEFGNAVNRAIAEGTHIISASVLWPLDGPGDGTGFLADIVANARSNGIFYAGASGNYAERSWSGTFTDINNDDLHEWVSGQNINYFGPGGGFAYVIPSGYPIQVFLQWDDWVGVDQDYDMELYYWDGDSWELVATASDVQNGGPGQQPFEYIGILAPFTASYGVVVIKSNASRDVCFRLIAPDLELDERVPARSFLFPADSPDVITVGAIDVSDPYPLEAYSSRGPTFGPGGSCSGGSIKPDVVGYANVSTVSYGSAAFAGTSAATPHVAGAAALLKDAYPSYTVTQLQQWVEGFALDLGAPGKDNLYGAGRLYLEGPPPTVTTEPTTSVTSTSATLNGTVNPNGSNTTYYFEHGLTQSYGSTTTEIDIGAGTDDVDVSTIIIVSDPLATYYYRLAATNALGTTYGADMTFTNDTDADSMPDDWEQQIIDDDPGDSITRIEDVLPDDDYDGDALTNLEEYQQVTVPTDFDTDDDDLPDGWEVSNGLDPLDSTEENGGEGDFDDDGWTNYEEYIEGADPRDDTSPPPTPPQVMESTPRDGAGLQPETAGVPNETSFAVRINDSDGINITDTTSVKFTVDDDADDPLNTPYERDLRSEFSDFVRVLKLTSDLDTQVTELWVVYDRSQDTYGNFAYNSKVNIKVDAKDRRQDLMAQASFDFRIESEAEHDYAQAKLPDTSDVAQDDPDLGGVYDAGVQVNSGDLEGAKILYDGSEPIEPTFGPMDEVPPLNTANVDAVGVPMNLLPPTVFNTPVRIFIPCPGYTDVSQLSVFLYNGTGWVLACDPAGIVQPGAEGWMVPGSRVNHNNGNPSTIEIQVYHFSGVQSGLSSSPQVAGGGGGGG